MIYIFVTDELNYIEKFLLNGLSLANNSIAKLAQASITLPCIHYDPSSFSGSMNTMFHGIRWSTTNFNCPIHMFVHRMLSCSMGIRQNENYQPAFSLNRTSMAHTVFIFSTRNWTCIDLPQLIIIIMLCFPMKLAIELISH